jgi:hypothetical protein
MPRLSWMVLLVGAVVLARPCAAQEESLDVQVKGSRAASPPSPSMSISHTPEMWFYEQERIRYEDPKMAVRRRAELRAAQRSERIAAQEWYGINNSRPMVSTTPMFESYSPYWSSNTYDPKRWRPYGTPTAVLVPIPMRY